MRYYKHSAETEHGEGVAYVEVNEEGTVVRQVEIYGQRIFWSDLEKESDPDLPICDQPFEELGLGPGDEVAKREFDEHWRHAQTT